MKKTIISMLLLLTTYQSQAVERYNVVITKENSNYNTIELVSPSQPVSKIRFENLNAANNNVSVLAGLVLEDVDGVTTTKSSWQDLTASTVYGSGYETSKAVSDNIGEPSSGEKNNNWMSSTTDPDAWFEATLITPMYLKTIYFIPTPWTHASYGLSPYFNVITYDINDEVLNTYTNTTWSNGLERSEPYSVQTIDF